MKKTVTAAADASSWCSRCGLDTKIGRRCITCQYWTEEAMLRARKQRLMIMVKKAHEFVEDRIGKQSEIEFASDMRDACIERYVRLEGATKRPRFTRQIWKDETRLKALVKGLKGREVPVQTWRKARTALKARKTVTAKPKPKAKAQAKAKTARARKSA